MNDCCIDNLDDAVWEGHCTYKCPICGCDVSFLWFLYMNSLNEDTHINTRKKKREDK